MELPKWTAPALQGAAVGAVTLAIAGFNGGGWVTGGTASKMIKDASNTAVAAALTPHCIARSAADPEAPRIRATLDKAGTWQKRGIIEKSGWATPLGTDKPSWELAEACLRELQKDTGEFFPNIIT